MYFLNAFKYETLGRPMSGICVFINRLFKDYFTQINTDSKFCILFKVKKVLFNTYKDILMCFMYLPPYNSPAYREERCKGIDYLQTLLTDISGLELKLISECSDGKSCNMGTLRDFPGLVACLCTFLG